MAVIFKLNVKIICGCTVTQFYSKSNFKIIFYLNKRITNTLNRVEIY